MENVGSIMEAEFAVIQSIYGEQFKYSIPNNDLAYCEVTLNPGQAGVKSEKLQPTVVLRITLPTTYPETCPIFLIINSKGIKKSQEEELINKLKAIATKRIGNEVILEICHEVEDYLFNFGAYSDRFESFFDQRRDRIKSYNNKKKMEKLSSEHVNREQVEKRVHQIKKHLHEEFDRLETSKHEDRPSLSDSASIKLDCEVEIEINPTVEFKNERKFKCKTDRECLNNFLVNAPRLRKDFTIEAVLGRGSFGAVAKVKNKLDGCYYAVKRLKPHVSESVVLREIRFLSRVNHENVVRYYNAWTEHDTDFINEILNDFDSSNMDEEEYGETFDMLFSNTKSNVDEEDDDNIVFEKTLVDKSPSDDDSSDGYVNDGEKNNNIEIESLIDLSTKPSIESIDPSVDKLIKSNEVSLFIQMELCEGNSLRRAIACDCLYTNRHRAWRLFRELIEGLNHIHQSGIIHRDLKPSNIFISVDDHIKIGDFGLATIEYSSKEIPEMRDHDYGEPMFKHTGGVGTSVYMAPEIWKGVQSKYNQKADMYSIGIILFEIFYPHMITEMERITTIKNVRKFNFPDYFNTSENSDVISMIKQLLHRNCAMRPSAKKLLEHEKMPPRLIEGQHVISVCKQLCKNDSVYKHVVQSIFKKKQFSSVIEPTYNEFHEIDFLNNLEIHNIMTDLRTIFESHGAINFKSPIFIPDKGVENAVNLITIGGVKVHLNYDMLTPFARHLAKNSEIQQLKKYTFDRVFRERPIERISPAEHIRCSFDIVTSSDGDLLPEFELFNIIGAIIKKNPQIFSEHTIYLNHKKIFDFLMTCFGFDLVEHEYVLNKICKLKGFSTFTQEMEKKINEIIKNKIKATNKPNIDEPIHLSKLFEIVLSDSDVEKKLSSLLPSVDFTTCRPYFEQLKLIMDYCKQQNINNVKIALGLLENAFQYSDLMYQVVIKKKIGDKSRQSVISVPIIKGGRYDSLIDNYKKELMIDKKVDQHAAGLIVLIDQMVEFSENQRSTSPTLYDVLICTIGSCKIEDEKLNLVHYLWKLELKTIIFDQQSNLINVMNFAHKNSIKHIIIFKGNDPNFARLKILNENRKYIEKRLKIEETSDYFTKEVSFSKPKGVNSPIKTSEDVPLKIKRRNTGDISTSSYMARRKYSLYSIPIIETMLSTKEVYDILGFIIEGKEITTHAPYNTQRRTRNSTECLNFYNQLQQKLIDSDEISIYSALEKKLIEYRK